MYGDKMMTKEEMITAAKMIEIEMITLEAMLTGYVKKNYLRYTMKVCAEAAHDIAKTLEENYMLSDWENVGE